MAVAAERSMLQSAGHVVELHEFHNPDATAEAVIALALAPWNRRAAREVVEHAIAFGADVVHVHNTWFALSPAVFAGLRQAGFPTVATIHNYRLSCVNALFYRDGRVCQDCLGRWPWPGVVHRCYRNSVLQSAAVAVTIGAHRAKRTWTGDVDVVVALSDFAAETLVESGVDRANLAVKPNAVADPGERPSAPSHSQTCLFVGRFTEDKGVLDLLEAWGGAGDRGLELVMVGDGPLLNWVEDHKQGGVTLVGREPAEKIAERMLGARCLILPSRWFEGMPMVLLEAMAAGLGVVIPDHGALREIAGHGGITFRYGDRAHLGRVLGSIQSDEVVDRVGAAARTEYLERYDVTQGCQNLVAVYRRAIATHKGRSA